MSGDLFSHVEHHQAIRVPLGTTPGHEGPWSIWLIDDGWDDLEDEEERP